MSCLILTITIESEVVMKLLSMILKWVFRKKNVLKCYRCNATMIMKYEGHSEADGKYEIYRCEKCSAPYGRRISDFGRGTR
jgi:DNA-directed RNA polymerase subunit RPC12/RpoP